MWAKAIHIPMPNNHPHQPRTNQPSAFARAYAAARERGRRYAIDAATSANAKPGNGKAKESPLDSIIGEGWEDRDEDDNGILFTSSPDRLFQDPGQNHYTHERKG